MYKVHPITALICYYLASAIGMNPRPMSKGWTPLHWIIIIMAILLADVRWAALGPHAWWQPLVGMSVVFGLFISVPRT